MWKNCSGSAGSVLSLLSAVCDAMDISVRVKTLINAFRIHENFILFKHFGYASV